tara:strand:+ start:519 stop:743 length:225 start_codon:yes stop_codon:yes gene_type:complete
MKPENEFMFEDALTDARKALVEAASYLELDRHECSECGTEKYEFFSDKLANSAISAAIYRIDLTRKKRGTFVYD